MKTAIKTKTTEEALLAGAKSHFDEAQAAIRKGCGHALLAGMHMIRLHADTSSGQGGDKRSINVPRGTLIKGFESNLAEIGIAKTTAYRWMDATYKACLRATLIFDGEDIAEALPEFGSAKWKAWEKNLTEVAQGMSLNRLMLGNSQPSTEEHRFDELISATEEGRQRAFDLLEGVAEGRYTLVQAVRSLGSQEAYDKLRSEGGEKIRKDPVYLMMDGATGHLSGLFPKSITTLRNTFTHWDDQPVAAKKKAREIWLDLVESMPSDLRNG